LTVGIRGLTLHHVKLYQSPDLDGRWVAEDQDGALVHWPNEPKGWLKRTPFTGNKRQLVEVDYRLARKTGWPGGPTGRPPASLEPTKMFGIRATVGQIAKWSRRAKDEGKKPSVWAKEELDAALDRPAKKSK
jgi:hypothetical protein